MLVWLNEKVVVLVSRFLLNPITPQETLTFEEALGDLVRELGRQVLEWTINAAEPEAAADQPHDLWVNGSGYRRLGDKTPNRDVATTFGVVTLWRRGYRSWHRGDGEPTIFPLEITLGLVEKTTPALAGRIAHRMAEAGMTQRLALDWLRQEHGVWMGVPRLRRLTEQIAPGLEEQRERWQVRQLLAWLTEASQSAGRHLPVLAVGRDGVTFHVQGFYEVGSTATVSVYDRRGRRLGTVYLAQPSESFQATLSEQLTRLIQRTLAAWEGRLPRLCYVTDAGDAETRYFRGTLRRMRHPRDRRVRLEWIRVVDYFHVAERLGALADGLRFSCERDRRAWIRKMRKLLKKPRGVARVLHSAAALRAQLGGFKSQAKAFETARRYLRKQRRFTDYAAYRRVGLPIGSGVTEAACKTIFMQRLKLSGMQWDRAGAQVILRLRVVLLSGIWDPAYRGFVSQNHSHIRVYAAEQNVTAKSAA